MSAQPTELSALLRKVIRADIVEWRDIQPIVAAASLKIERLEAENAWRPIESAPIGRKILICWRNGDQAVGHMDDLPGHEGFYLAYSIEERKEMPTHWKPLPEPPALKEQP